jgi:hypothetical protein
MQLLSPVGCTVAAFAFIQSNLNVVALLLFSSSQANSADANEGELSVQKATLVRNVALVRKAQGPHSQLQLDRHMLLLPLSSVKDCAADYTPTGSYPQANSSSSRGFAVGLQRPSSCERLERGKRLADGVEALIGAVYLTAAAAAGGGGGGGGAVLPGAGVGPQSSSSSSMPVSEQGLAAAAAFCEAVGILPPGALLASNLASVLSSCYMRVLMSMYIWGGSGGAWQTKHLLLHSVHVSHCLYSSLAAVTKGHHAACDCAN